MLLKRIDWQVLQSKREEASKLVQLEFSFYDAVQQNESKSKQ